jgi:dCTP diphosphatase
MKGTRDQLLAEILRFRDKRDWAKFHTAKNLSAAIAIEAAELQEHFLWKSDDDVAEYLKNPSKKRGVEDELADVIIFSMLLADQLGVDMDMAVRRKVRENAKKYPVAKSKGVATKYTEI